MTMSEMKFKVGDVVRITRADRHDKIIGAIATVVEIAPDWMYPYGVEYEREDFRREAEHGLEDLFDEDSIELVARDIDKVIEEIEEEIGTLLPTGGFFPTEKAKLRIDGELGEAMKILERPEIILSMPTAPSTYINWDVAKVEDVIDLLVKQLKSYEGNREYSLAITHLQEAQNWLYRLDRKGDKNE